MFALSDEHRQHLMHISIMIVCGGMAILPFTVPPTSATARAQAATRTSSITVPAVPGRLKFPEIRVDRDPFVANDPVAASHLSTDAVRSGYGGTDDIGIVLPPNVGARGAPPDGSSGGVPIVRGIVLGDAPQALVEAGNDVKVYSVGDSIGSDTITSIDAEGITLSSGVRLAIVHQPQ